MTIQEAAELTQRLTDCLHVIAHVSETGYSTDNLGALAKQLRRTADYAEALRALGTLTLTSKVIQ